MSSPFFNHFSAATRRADDHPAPGRNDPPARTVLLKPENDDALAAERSLDARGVPLPVSSRVSYVRHLGTPDSRLVAALDERGGCLAMLGLTATPTRVLPGHRVLRLEAVGEVLASPAGAAVLRAVARHARETGRVLRLVVELKVRDTATRDDVRETLRSVGFHRVPAERVPERTLVIDLVPEEHDILATFGRSTRQNIRGAVKHELELVPLVDPRYSERMNALLAGSLARTGAAAQQKDWTRVMQVCAEIPHRSRLIGVFRGPGREPRDLLGFAWGVHHGDRVEYHTGASARIPGVRLSILHPALWDLITWGKRNGGTWFDLGGVTGGSLGSNDTLGGISGFKRGFSKEEISLGEEWALEPRAFKWWAATLGFRLARRVRRWLLDVPLRIRRIAGS